MESLKKIECKAFSEQRCRSCSIIESEYRDGLRNKIELLTQNFTQNLKSNVIETSNLLEYRNKSKFVVSGSLERPIIGIPSPLDKFVYNELLDCPINNNILNEIANQIKLKIKTYLLTPYDLQTRKGEFKYLILSHGFNTADISIRFGMRSSESMPRVKKLVSELMESYSNIKVVSFEIQPKHAAIFDGDITFLTQDKYILNEFKSYKLLSSVQNFFQVNSQVAQDLYSHIGEYFKEIRISNTLDLFCGVGGFSFEASRFSENVLGIELNQNAIDCAIESLNLNNVKNIKFICDDAFNFRNYSSEQVDLIIVNPPRRGIGEKFCNLIIEISPEYLVYSSCNPDTLQKDSLTLSKKYTPVDVKAVDMFALTNHLEVITIWKRIK